MSSNNAGPNKPPAHLSPAAKKVWIEQIKARPTDYYTTADIPSLESLVSAICNLRDANKALKENNSLFSVGSQGQLIQHPAVRIQADAIRLINQTTQAIAARKAALAAEPAKANTDPDDLDDLLP